MLAKASKNQIVWRGSQRPMLLKSAPISSTCRGGITPRTAFPEKLNRWIWRWGFNRTVEPPGGRRMAVPAYYSRRSRRRHRPNAGESCSSPAGYEMPSYIPEDADPEEIVPGTRRTWNEGGRRFPAAPGKIRPKPQTEQAYYIPPPDESLRAFNPQLYENGSARLFTRGVGDASAQSAAPTRPTLPPRTEPSSSVPPGGGQPPRGDVLAELDALIGLDKVKAEVRRR